VTVQIKWDDGSSTTHHGYFDVQAPTLYSFTSETDTVNAEPSGTHGAGVDDLSFGYHPDFGDPGIRWLVDVGNTTDWAATVRFTQIGDSLREIVDAADVTHTLETEGFQLDSTVEYEADSLAKGVRTEAPDPGNFTAWDTPAQAPHNADDKTLFASDIFEVYLMWFPAVFFGGVTPNWVTIGKLEWGWDGEAENQGGNLTLVDGFGSPNPTGSASAVFPEWEGLIQDNTWDPPWS
jgi:hypothetical protein